jgi:arginine decarboxylase
VTDPRGLRTDAPLLDAWLRFRERRPTPFTIPGHKQRTDLVGDVVDGDVPLHGGLDTVTLAHGVLADAERRAAALWGADVCHFSVGGSTHGNQALALAVGRPGDRVVVSRTLHRSVLLGIVLAGLEPVWVRPDVDPSTGLPTAVPAAAVSQALASHDRVCAVMVGDPSYVGTLGDVGGYARAAHAHGVPLVVDAAWAPHLGFHPALPRHALARGADALVVSAHKTLPAWSQGAFVLARTERIDPGRLARGVEATHTTSPSGAILASTDAARALLARDGEQLLDRTIRLVADARVRLVEVDGLAVLEGPGVDPTKLVVLLAGTGADGFAVERDLVAAGLPLEMADRDTLVPVVTMADDRVTVGRLLDALVPAVERHRGTPRPPVTSAAWTVDADVATGPREAFFAARATVPAAEAVGRVCAEVIAPYPPGIPVLAPGERIGPGVLEVLAEAHARGARIAYAADPTLATVQVVDHRARPRTRGPR